MTIPNLRGKPLDHWNRAGVCEELSARYEDSGPEERAGADKRIAALEALSDEQFASLDGYDLAIWLDAWQGFGDEFDVVLRAALPQTAPVPELTAEHAKAFLFIHEPDAWPVVAVLNPWERLAIGGRDQVMTHGGEYPSDAMGSRPQLWWMPHGSETQPHLRLGWWPAGGGRPLLLSPCSASLHSHLSHSLMPHYVPPRAGWLRARVGGWAASQNRSLRDEDGEWSEPLLLDRVFLSTKGRDAWTPTYIQDVPDADLVPTRGGRRMAWAEASDLVPTIPIEVAGDPDWAPRGDQAPAPFDSDWTPPPLPTAQSAPAVSDEAKAWLISRAKRYGRSKSSGRFWRELAETLT